MTEQSLINFSLFVAWWNRVQHQSTPSHHFDIAQWIQNRLDQGDQNLLLLAFRGCGKSTLIGLYAAWRLTINPNFRILVLSADDHLAIRMVRNVRRIIERHPACCDILPENPNEWAADRFTIKRSADLRDPSMVAAGITGNITGMRADLIICDDVEVPNTSDTVDKREELRTRLHELSFIKSSDATMLYIGTPHAFDTIYADKPRDDIPGHIPFLDGFKTLRLPIYTKDGSSRWPEKFNLDKIHDIQRRVGQARFQSQMMLAPYNINDSYLDPASIDFYDDSLLYIKEIRKTYLGDRQILSIRAFWDPALATGSRDKSVVAVIAIDTTGHYFLHHLAYLNVTSDANGNIAQAQCKAVADILERFRIPVMGIEINGIGQMLPGILREIIAQAHLGTSIIGVTHHGPKNERIIQALETPMAARMVHAHQSLLRTRFFDELRDFKPNHSGNHDDGLDAVASALAMEPLRRPHTFNLNTSVRPLWRVQG